jgi:hypothetical protein
VSLEYGVCNEIPGNTPVKDTPIYKRNEEEMSLILNTNEVEIN